MNNVIVTGGTGFIGSWLIDELLNQNIGVITLIRNASKLKGNWLENKKFFYIEKELMDLKKEDFYSFGEIDAWFHLAWDGVDEKQKNNFDKQINNIKMTTHLFELCAQISCPKFIATGSVAEYVLCPGVMNYDEKQTPNDLYGATKVATHYFLDVLSRKWNQPFVWVILPSTFGENRMDNNIITYTIRTLINKEKPIYGNLNQMWDFLYVSEVARALVLIAERGDFSGVTYGIGSGNYRKLREYIIAIRDLIDSDLPLGIGENPKMDERTYSSCVNVEDFINDTGFIPQISFKEGIMRTINYFKGIEHE